MKKHALAGAVLFLLAVIYFYIYPNYLIDMEPYNPGGALNVGGSSSDIQKDNGIYK